MRVSLHVCVIINVILCVCVSVYIRLETEVSVCVCVDGLDCVNGVLVYVYLGACVHVP